MSGLEKHRSIDRSRRIEALERQICHEKFARCRPVASAALKDGIREVPPGGSLPAAEEARDGARSGGGSAAGARRGSSPAPAAPKAANAAGHGSCRRRSAHECASRAPLPPPSRAGRREAVASVVAAAAYLRKQEPLQPGTVPDAARLALGRTARRPTIRRCSKPRPAISASRSRRWPCAASGPNCSQLAENDHGPAMQPRLAGPAALRGGSLRRARRRLQRDRHRHPLRTAHAAARPSAPAGRQL